MCLGWHIAQYHDFCNSSMPSIRCEAEHGLAVPGLHQDVKTTSLLIWFTETDPSLPSDARRILRTAAAGVNVSGQSIRNRLRATNLRSRRPAVPISVTQRHRELRLERCWRQMRWNRLRWLRVVLSDESSFSLRGNDGRIHVYRRRGECFSNATVNEHDRYSGCPIIVWAGVSLHRKLCIIGGNLTALAHVDEILQPVVVPFLTQVPSFNTTTTDHIKAVIYDFVRQLNID